jgi:ketosteroid isomerase-like protein
VSRPIFTTALEAEAAFYQALAKGDFEALMTVWSEEEEVVCIPPGGPRIVGLAAVRETWRRILANGSPVQIEVSQAVTSASAMMAMHCIVERLGADGPGQRSTTLVATNIYVRGADGWRMVLHHASPVPELSDFGEQSPRIVH